MIVLRRSKSFSSPEQSQEVTSRDLLVEQMKQQRQLLQTQRLREKLQAQERRDMMKNLREAQKDSDEDKNDQMKNQVKINKIQAEQNDGAKNVSLYKTRAKTVPPVSMKV
ncbi:MAG: hypothetical protein J6I84_04755 [Bacilli bacterium]|nr:hypothetical protein [Bacilli bacterium]